MTDKLQAVITIIIEGRFSFSTVSSSKLVLKTVESCFVDLNYYENGSMKGNFWFESAQPSGIPYVMHDTVNLGTVLIIEQPWPCKPRNHVNI
jgi:hypothetical protein